MVCLALSGCEAKQAPRPIQAQATSEELAELTVEFKQRIDKVADGVWMAIVS